MSTPRPPQIEPPDRAFDLAARAMAALADDLTIPAEVEARLLGAIPVAALDDAAPARATRLAPERDRIDRRATRRWIVAASAVAIAIGGAIAGGSWLSHRDHERADVTRDRAADRAAAEVVGIDWNDGASWRGKMDALERLRAQISGPASRESTARLAPRYLEGVRRAFLDATRDRLEAEIRSGAADRSTMKQYLLLGDPKALPAEGAWLADALTRTAAEATGAKNHIGEGELAPILRPHLVAFVFLVETKLAPAVPLDPELAARARRALAGD